MSIAGPVVLSSQRAAPDPHAMATLAGSAVAPSRVATPRVAWLDAARGIGIVLVVFGHCVIGLQNGSLIPPHGSLVWLNAGIYTFHMPLFFFAAGLVVPRRLAHNRAGFLRDAALRIAWPYLLWSMLQLGVIGASSHLVNLVDRRTPWQDFASLWAQPSAQFWFLYSLFLLHAAALALLPWLGRQWFVLLLGTAYALAAVFTTMPYPILLTAQMGLFYAAGAWAADSVLVSNRIGRPGVALATLAGFLAVASLTVWLGVPTYAPGQLPAAALGILATALLCTLPLVQCGPLCNLGRQTMPIYLMHIFFAAGTRIALTHGLHLCSAALVLPATVAAGLAGPLVAYRAILRLRIAPWLGMPS